MMSNAQLYFSVGVPLSVAIAGFGVMITLLLHFVNKLDASIKEVRLTLDAVRQDIAEIKTGRRVQDVEIAT